MSMGDLPLLQSLSKVTRSHSSKLNKKDVSPEVKAFTEDREWVNVPLTLSASHLALPPSDSQFRFRIEKELF